MEKKKFCSLIFPIHTKVSNENFSTFLPLEFVIELEVALWSSMNSSEISRWVVSNPIQIGGGDQIAIAWQIYCHFEMRRDDF